MQSVRTWKRCSNNNIKKGERQREHFFSFIASSNAFCSVRGTKGTECISPPSSSSSSLHRVHVIIVVMQWQWPIHSRLQGNACCVRALTALLLNKLLYFSFFVLSFFSFFFFFFFFSSFFLLFALQLPCMRVCVYTWLQQQHQLVFVTGHPLTATTSKSIIHVSTRTNKREKEKDQSIRYLLYYYVYIISTIILETLLLQQKAHGMRFELCVWIYRFNRRKSLQSFLLHYLLSI